MNEPKKLLSFILKDEFSLSLSEIQSRAEAMADEQAVDNGWSRITIKLAGDSYVQEDKFKCYPFDVFGYESDAQDNGSSDSESKSSVKSVSRGIAAQAL